MCLEMSAMRCLVKPLAGSASNMPAATQQPYKFKALIQHQILQIGCQRFSDLKHIATIKNNRVYAKAEDYKPAWWNVN